MSTRRKRKASAETNGEISAPEEKRLAPAHPAPFVKTDKKPVQTGFVRMTKEEALAGKYDRPARIYAGSS